MSNEDESKANFMRAREILSADPDNPWALVEMARIFHAKGVSERAEGFIARALKLDPFNEEYQRLFDEIRAALPEK